MKISGSCAGYFFDECEKTKTLTRGERVGISFCRIYQDLRRLQILNDMLRKKQIPLMTIHHSRMKGLKRLITNGKKLSNSPVIEALEQEYKETTDSVAMYLEYYQYKPDSQVEQGIMALYNEYKRYCEDNRLIMETRANFRMNLRICWLVSKR